MSIQDLALGKYVGDLYVGLRWGGRSSAIGFKDLVPVTAANRRAVGDLVIHQSQERFVPPMVRNFGDAARGFEPSGLISGGEAHAATRLS